MLPKLQPKTILWKELQQMDWGELADGWLYQGLLSPDDSNGDPFWIMEAADMYLAGWKLAQFQIARRHCKIETIRKYVKFFNDFNKNPEEMLKKLKP